MGSPAAPTPAQVAELQSAAQLAVIDTHQPRALGSDELALALTLPRQAVSLVVLDWN
jgi:xylan 1,4-beta-xylosidase